jgi:hypothetical protein
MRRLVHIATGLVAGLFLFGATQAWATPSFARKYGASCQTCHIAYPKLNNFGNAFRLLGYRMPGETEEMVKQPDVELGAPAYKKVWPKSVWPGAVPSHIPLAFATNFMVENSSTLENGEREIVHNDFRFPDEAELIVAGIAGDHVAYFGEIEFEREIEDGESHWDLTVGHLDIRLIQPIANSSAFNVKIGSFQPELVATFDHARRLTVANYDSMFGVQTLHEGGAKEVGGGHHGGGAIALPQVAEGFEFFGVAAKRFLWSAGLVNGLGPGEEAFDAYSAKDAYVSIGYKWGGLAPDGSNAETYVGSAKNWQETSFRLGVFAYTGDGERGAEEIEAAIMDPDPTAREFVEDEDFTRVGMEFNLFFKDLNVFGAYVDGTDDINFFIEDPFTPGVPILDPAESGEFDYTSWFVEFDAVLGWPFLHGALRYETVDLPHVEMGVPVEDWERATASLIGLIRANVKAFAEYTWDLDVNDNYRVYAGMGIAF